MRMFLRLVVVSSVSVVARVTLANTAPRASMSTLRIAACDPTFPIFPEIFSKSVTPRLTTAAIQSVTSPASSAPLWYDLRIDTVALVTLPASANSALAALVVSVRAPSALSAPKVALRRS